MKSWSPEGSVPAPAVSDKNQAEGLGVPLAWRSDLCHVKLQFMHRNYKWHLEIHMCVNGTQLSGIAIVQTCWVKGQNGEVKMETV